MVMSESASGADVVRAYIGTYTEKGSEGIYVLELDRDAGTVTEARVAAQQKNPSFVAVHPKNTLKWPEVLKKNV